MLAYVLLVFVAQICTEPAGNYELLKSLLALGTNKKSLDALHEMITQLYVANGFDLPECPTTGQSQFSVSNVSESTIIASSPPSPSESPNSNLALNNFSLSEGSLSSSVLSSSGAWLEGHATHYGPFPQFPAWSEVGYQPNEVGLGCSTGIVGGDPRWNEIIAKGTLTNPLMPSTIWPITPTVAVSGAIWDKLSICFKTLKIRSRSNRALEIEAVVVDFCPAASCLWPKEELRYNVDVYGGETWKNLGGEDLQGVLEIEILWPYDVVPNLSV